MLPIKFQTSELSGSEEDIIEYLYVFLWSNLGPPDAGPSRTQGPLFEQTWYRTTRHAMLHAMLQASQQSGSEEDDFVMFFNVFLWFEPMPSGAGPAWTLGPSCEQIW